jgi:putative transposase
VIDVFARRIVGWKGSHAMRTDFVLDALEQALHHCGDEMAGLVHHSDRGVQHVSMRYTERLADAGIAPSVGSRGDAYDNAVAESVIGLYKTEVIGRRDRWHDLEAVDLRRFAGWIGLTIAACSAPSALPPAEHEANYYQQASVA